MSFSGEINNKIRFWLAFTGLALLITGVTKALTHMLASPEFIICGSGGASQSSFLSFNASAHCWGCPVAIVGMMMLLIAAATMPSHGMKHGDDMGHLATGR